MENDPTGAQAEETGNQPNIEQENLNKESEVLVPYKKLPEHPVYVVVTNPETTFVIKDNLAFKIKNGKVAFQGLLLYFAFNFIAGNLFYSWLFGVVVYQFLPYWNTRMRSEVVIALIQFIIYIVSFLLVVYLGHRRNMWFRRVYIAGGSLQLGILFVLAIIKSDGRSIVTALVSLFFVILPSWIYLWGSKRVEFTFDKRNNPRIYSDFTVPFVEPKPFDHGESNESYE